MREINLLSSYPQPSTPRVVGPGMRTIKNRLVAWRRDREFFDGDRSSGYGGLKDDGRWASVAAAMIAEYRVSSSSSVLQLGCEKGFLLRQFQLQQPGVKVVGVESSDYARAQAEAPLAESLMAAPYVQLPFPDGSFDLVIAIGAVYTLNLGDSVSCLKEIARVGSGRSFITLGAFRNEEERRLMSYWSLLGTTILHVDEWCEVLEYVGYRGDYSFVTAGSLNLVENAER